jgi:opacity protein-like surface antigen
MTKFRQALGGLTIASAMALAGNAAHANEPSFYVEGSLGQASVSDVKTESYSGTTEGLIITNLQATVDYDSPTYLGFEIGVLKPISLPIRVGFGFTSFKLKLDSATITGSVGDGDTSTTFTGTATRSRVLGAGLDFDNRVKIYSLNAYYDFETNSAFKPYIGVGLGMTDIENAKDNEFTSSVHLGLNYDIDKNVYLGAKYSRYFVSGPQDGLGIKYKDVDAQAFGLTVGYRF